MKLLIPVISSDDVESFSAINKNAEFYVGISLVEWSKRFGVHENLNRMSEFKRTANMDGISALKSVCNAASGHDVYVTINAGSYSREQIKFLDNVISELAEAGANGIIAGDAYIVEIIKKHNLKAIASTMIGVYNADIAAFCADIGFDRIILPRDMTLAEIAEIVKAVPHMEYECFLMRNGCRYSDSNCLARHSDKYGAICTYLDRSRTAYFGEEINDFNEHEKMLFSHLAFSHVYQKQACGMCAIWDLRNIGVCAGKIVGRADGADSIINDLICAEENIRISNDCDSREQYLKRMKMPYNYDSICYRGCNCYYPDIRF